jgi:hypothetical protein
MHQLEQCRNTRLVAPHCNGSRIPAETCKACRQVQCLGFPTHSTYKCYPTLSRPTNIETYSSCIYYLRSFFTSPGLFFFFSAHSCSFFPTSPLIRKGRVLSHLPLFFLAFYRSLLQVAHNTIFKHAVACVTGLRSRSLFKQYVYSILRPNIY